MANEIYPKWKQRSMESGVPLGDNNVRAYLIDTGVYTYSDSHTFVSDLGSGIVGSQSGTFQNKTFTDGIFDADNINFTAVTGNSAEALVIFIDTGNASTSRLVAYLDTGFTGLPITPNGDDIPVVWPADGIFKL
jgi:hypothetical protein